MIKIVQKQAVRGYQIPTFGMRELRQGELIKEDSNLGKALLNYFPSICKIEKDKVDDNLDSDIITENDEGIEGVDEEVEEAKTELLVEDPEDCAVVEEVFEDVIPQDITVEEKLEAFTDKDDLDEWAEKEFSIKLSRAKSLKNMKKDFLAQYSK